MRTNRQTTNDHPGTKLPTKCLTYATDVTLQRFENQTDIEHNIMSTESQKTKKMVLKKYLKK